MDTLLHMGLSNALVATLLAVLVFAISRACRRPAVVHTLWLLVLVKLVTPAPLTLPIRWPAEPAQMSHEAEAVAIASSAHVPHWSEVVRDLAVTISGWLDRSWGLLLAVWLAGSVAWFALAGFRSYRFARLLRHARPAPAAVSEEARRLAAQLGLTRCPSVWLLPGMLSPMLWGLGRRARLLLPADLVARLDAEQLRTLLAHELAHARRGDPWVRVFELLVLGLYWWHPVAWWAQRRLREAEEQCCDAWVVWTLPAAAPSYATALVETVAFLSTARPALPPVASGVGYVRTLKRRLTLILSSVPPQGASAAGLLAVLGLGVVLLPWRPVWAQAEPAPCAQPVWQPPAIEARDELQAKADLPRLLEPPPEPVIPAKKDSDKEAEKAKLIVTAKGPPPGSSRRPEPPPGPRFGKGPPPRGAGHPGPGHPGGRPHGPPGMKGGGGGFRGDGWGRG